ncbi:hypothetical protein IEO21_10312 [Rhodonia placenta]|uniref:DUF6535 domain-containing protein n=1 Tax=Rhodonia placenta TaxID=104341 RepID=A0A8H7TXF3_9APHY|nr:hypothetical protein IEO21_10312 [Postia placenta]
MAHPASWLDIASCVQPTLAYTKGMFIPIPWKRPHGYAHQKIWKARDPIEMQTRSTPISMNAPSSLPLNTTPQNGIEVGQFQAQAQEQHTSVHQTVISPLQQQQPVTSENHGTIPIDREGRRSDLDNGRLSDTKVQDGTERDNLKSVLNADSGRTYVRSAEKGELTGRARRAKEVWTFEDKRLERWKNDIANIFLFAGLFSTVLTAYIVSFYGYQEQTVDPTAQPLSLIPPTSIFWTIALILSLWSSATAIIVGRWLHHHVNRGASLDRQSVRPWYFRHRGLKTWHVQAIINTLSFVLQSAMALFLVGLVEQLWTMTQSSPRVL